MPTKEYRPYTTDQLLILPPALQEWLPEGHLAYFIRDLVRSFDLTQIEATYEDELRGAPPYHPEMMGGGAAVRLLHRGVQLAADHAAAS